MRTLTNSAVQTFWRCQREYYYAYSMKIRPEKKGAALEDGGAFHDWMETGEVGVDDSPTVHSMVMAYSEYYGGRAPTSEREMVLEAPLVNPKTGRQSRTFKMAGMVDGVWPDGDASLLYELKTTSMSMEVIASSLRHGTQLHTYGALWRHRFGDLPDGYVVDVVRKPKFKQKAGETTAAYTRRMACEMIKTPDKYFLREVLPCEEHRILGVQNLFWRTAEAIREADRSGFVRCRGTHCMSVYGGCQYRRLCWHEITDGYRIADVAHEELGIER